MTETAKLAQTLLCEALVDPAATFHEDQLEAITALVDENARLLVVERTGWGKSMVYFIATAILRSRGKGPTLIVSPLLSLMRNQLEAASRLGLRAATINSSNQDDHADIFERIRRNEVDILLVSPERLQIDSFREEVLVPMLGNVAFLVVDEAHCVSDWGHDFRPDYRRLVRIVNAVPATVPVLATTATANNRVVSDVLGQIGESARVIRGSLRRDSLRLQTIQMPNYAARLAWLAQHLPDLPGCGIVYTLTRRDSDRVTEWLCSQGINALAYHAGLEDREALEQELVGNRVKALVATVALGMGFDKPDIGFVVHFQRPASAVDYYQQIGRAGRALPNAFAILLSGAEDDEIADYFIRTALQNTGLAERIVSAVRANVGGLTRNQISNLMDTSDKAVDRALKFLSTESPTPIIKERDRWRATAVQWQVDAPRLEAVVAHRKAELARMQDYVNCQECQQVFLARELDSADLEPCGTCANCVGAHLVPATYSVELAQTASRSMGRAEIEISPRLKWPDGGILERNHGWRGKIDSSRMNSIGRALCVWGDPGFGEAVRLGKKSGHFDDQLVLAVAEMYRHRWTPSPQAEWVTFVPSLRHSSLVADFASRLAAELRLPLVPCVIKVRETDPQKSKNNARNQAKNIAGAFAVDSSGVESGAVLLVDDMVDSRWTFTIVGALLLETGSGPVYPVALASTARNEA